MRPYPETRERHEALNPKTARCDDLTFAALATPVLLPAECRAVQPALDTVPAAMREEILRFRETDAGRFALRMFSQERGYSFATSQSQAL